MDSVGTWLCLSCEASGALFPEACRTPGNELEVYIIQQHKQVSPKCANTVREQYRNFNSDHDLVIDWVYPGGELLPNMGCPDCGGHMRMNSSRWYF